MSFTDLLTASSPIIVLTLCLVWRGVPALIEWRRERRYQAEWHQTFGTERSRHRADGHVRRSSAGPSSSRSRRGS